MYIRKPGFQVIVMFIDMFVHACNIAYFNCFSKPAPGQGRGIEPKENKTEKLM